jgi:lipoate-protein ligase A
VELYNLGKVPWEESQLMYHALAKLGRESLCLVSPATPYVCIGFHQDVEQEVDLEFCKNNDIPVFRREVGGGAVYLDGNQLFFQLIIQRENPIAPRRIGAFYKKFLQPVIEVHHRIGLEAKYKPVNDLVIETRKISGTGAAEIGDSIVFVGNLILDFDYETMSRVLKIPNEKFRDKVKKSIEENLSTIRRELGEQKYEQWDEQTLNNMMVEEFEKLLGPLIPAKKNDVLVAKMKALETSRINDAWLFQKGKRVEGRVTIEDGKYKGVAISGDFFCFPRDSVERLAAMLEDCTTHNVSNVVSDFYQTEEFDIPGVRFDDWLQAFRI